MGITEQDISDHQNESNDYIELVNKLTSSYTIRLDNLIAEINSLLDKPDYMLDIGVLQKYYGKITLELYSIVDKLKNFEIYSSLSKAKSEEAYNKVYLKELVTTDAKKPTVAELQIKSTEGSKKESLINIVYNSAFKNINKKIDAGNNVAESLKNILRIKSNVDYVSNQTDNNLNN